MTRSLCAAAAAVMALSATTVTALNNGFNNGKPVLVSRQSP